MSDSEFSANITGVDVPTENADCTVMCALAPTASSESRERSREPRRPESRPYDLLRHISTSADEHDEQDLADQEHLHPVFQGTLRLRQVSLGTLSSSSSSSSAPSGCTTPHANPTPLQALGQEVAHHLAVLCMVGDDVIAQMHAQEIARWTRSTPPGTLATCLQFLNSMCEDYTVEGFEVGIAYTPGEGRWIASVLARVRQTAEALDRGTPQHQGGGQNDVDHDVACLVSGRPTRPEGRSRATESEARRSTRSRGRRSRSGRRAEADQGGHRGRDDRGHDDRRSPRNPVWCGLGPRAPLNSRTCPAPARPRGDDRRSDDASGSYTQSTRRLEPPVTRDDHPSLTPRQQALSFNRLTWRSLMGVEDEGPGMDINRWVPAPLDSTQTANIAATVEDMDHAQRLAMTTGFFRYLLELAHQTMQILVTGDPGDPGRSFNHEEFDEVMMIQMGFDIVADDGDTMNMVQINDKVIHQYRQLFQRLQHELETTSGNAKYRAGWILNMLEARSGGWMNYDGWHPELHALHSVLLVLSDGCRGLYSDEHTQNDTDFAMNWWKMIREYVIALEEGQTSGAASSSASPRGRPSTVIDLDSYPSNHNVSQENDAMSGAHDDSDVQLAQHLADQEAEERYMIQLLRTHEEEVKAEKYRQWEDWIVNNALQAVPVK